MEQARYKTMLMIRDNIRKEYPNFIKFSKFDPGKRNNFSILEKKLNSPPFRGFFTYAISQYLQSEGGSSYWHKETSEAKYFYETQLPLIVEIVIAIQYYHNQILDGKGGVNDSNGINDNLTDGNLLERQLFAYIEGSVSESIQYKITKCLRNIFDYVDIAQKIEKHCNTYENWLHPERIAHPFSTIIKKVIDPEIIDCAIEITRLYTSVSQEKLAFLKCYFERIYLLNAVLFRAITQFLCECFCKKDEQLIKFASGFGILQQIVNDISDFVPKEFSKNNPGKNAEDALSDFKNGNITLPLFIHLGEDRDSTLHIYLKKGKNQLSAQEEPQIVEELIKKLSIYRAMRVPKCMKGNMIKYLNKENSKLLEDAINIVENNEYYRFFYDHQCYKNEWKAYKKKNDFDKKRQQLHCT